MNRREFLAAVGTATSGVVAGCVTRPRLQLDDEARVSEGTIRVVDTYATRLLPTRGTVHPRVNGGSERQYVLFVFDVSNLALDDTQAYVRQNTELEQSPDTVATKFNGGTPLATFDNPERVAAVFELPAPFMTRDGVRLLWTGERSHIWDAATMMNKTGAAAYMESPPDFDILAFTATRTGPETGTATVRVGNDGFADGTFWALLGSTALSGQPVRSFEVPARETVRRTFELDLYRSSENSETIRLAWGEETLTETV